MGLPSVSTTSSAVPIAASASPASPTPAPSSRTLHPLPPHSGGTHLMVIATFALTLLTNMHLSEVALS
eukprot:3486667-Pyramimonas_sp.AAC.2